MDGMASGSGTNKQYSGHRDQPGPSCLSALSVRGSHPRRSRRSDPHAKTAPRRGCAIAAPMRSAIGQRRMRDGTSRLAMLRRAMPESPDASHPHLPRRRPHRHRLEVPARHRRVPGAHRRRSVPGAQRAARVELEGPAGPRLVARRDRADARASRSRRLPAAHRHAGLFRARVLHRRHEGSVPHRAARFRTHPGRGRGQREPPRVLAAPAGVAALRRGRCLPCRVAAPAGRLRAADAGRRRRRGGLHRRRPPARLRLRARSRRRNDDPVWRRSGALRPAGAARSRHRRAAPTTCSSNPPTATVCTRTTTTAKRLRR